MDENKKYLEAELSGVEEKIGEARELLNDESMAEMAKKELEDLEKQKALIIAAMNPVVEENE